MTKIARFLLILATLAAPAFAGRYPASGVQTFTFADNTTTFPPENATVASSTGATFASVSGNALRICRSGFGAGTGALKLPDIDPGKQMLAFDATFTVRMSKSSVTAVPGAGWAFDFGPLPADNGS